MNRIFLCLSFLLFSFAASSQKVYFVYLQSESGQPFYVKMNERIHSSSASGYLILSKLRDSTYSFTLGFPANKWPEHNFSVLIDRKDHGFLLKNFGEKGWGLFDLQTLVIQMPVAGSAKTASPVNTDNKEVSAFTEVLSKAADDPSLKEKPAVQPKAEEKRSEPVIAAVERKTEPVTIAVEKKPEPAIVAVEKKTEPVTVAVEKKPEPVIAAIEKKEEPKIEKVEAAPLKPIVAGESITSKEEQPKIIKDTVVEKKTTEITEQPVSKKEEPAVEVKEQVQAVAGENKTEPVIYKRSVVKRRSESSTTEGFGLVFTDELEDGTADTIKLLIPNPKTELVTLKEEPAREEKKFLEIAVSDSAAKPVENQPVAVEKTAGEKLKKNNCPGTADENDFFKVRKRMAAEDKDDNMVTEARKYFKTKCFATLQIKNLGSLFLTDESRYKFFDMAYTYVSDIENFSSLESELKDAYYINRFKAMLR